MQDAERHQERIELLKRARKVFLQGMLIEGVATALLGSGRFFLPDDVWRHLFWYGMFLCLLVFPVLATRALWRVWMQPREALLVFALVVVVLSAVQAALCPRFDIELRTAWSYLLGSNLLLAAYLTPLLYFLKALDELSHRADRVDSRRLEHAIESGAASSSGPVLRSVRSSLLRRLRRAVHEGICGWGCIACVLVAGQSYLEQETWRRVLTCGLLATATIIPISAVRVVWATWVSPGKVLAGFALGTAVFAALIVLAVVLGGFEYRSHWHWLVALSVLLGMTATVAFHVCRAFRELGRP